MRRRQACFKLIALALLVAFPAQIVVPAFALARQGDQTVVQNVRASRKGSQVTITYDLSGDNGRKYAVGVSLKREQDEGYSYAPEKVSGDVGEDVAPGSNKKIVWDFSEEHPSGLAGGDFYFVVTAEAQKTGGGISPLVWIGGAAAVGGAAALLLLSKKSSTGGETPPLVPATFPAEPGRPR